MLNERITSTDILNHMSSSTIAINGFTADDNGGIVQCTYLKSNATVRRKATVSIGKDSTCKLLLHVGVNGKHKGETVILK